MAARFAEPTKVEIVALFEKATPENTKKQLNMELRFLTVSLWKWRKISSNYKFKTNIETVHTNELWCLFHELKHDGWLRSGLFSELAINSLRQERVE